MKRALRMRHPPVGKYGNLTPKIAKGVKVLGKGFAIAGGIQTAAELSSCMGQPPK